MKFKVVTAGKCIICGKPIKLITPKDSSKFPNVLFCQQCENNVLNKKGGLKLNEQSRRESGDVGEGS